MSSIHKVRWASGGKEKSAWAVDYFDGDRKKRRRTFKTRREAVVEECRTQRDHGRVIKERAASGEGGTHFPARTATAIIYLSDSPRKNLYEFHTKSV
jgi:hypothetical protein